MLQKPGGPIITWLASIYIKYKKTSIFNHDLLTKSVNGIFFWLSNDDKC